MSNQGKSMYPPDEPPYHYDSATRTIRNEFNFVAGAVRAQNAHFLVNGANGYWDTREELGAALRREKKCREFIREMQQEMNEVQAVLAEALGYPHKEGFGWVVGAHSCVPLAMEARQKLMPEEESHER